MVFSFYYNSVITKFMVGNNQVLLLLVSYNRKMNEHL